MAIIRVTSKKDKSPWSCCNNAIISLVKCLDIHDVVFITIPRLVNSGFATVLIVKDVFAI